jgi:hypothetical protein
VAAPVVPDDLAFVVVATLVVDDPQVAAVLVVTEVQAVAVGDVGEGVGSGDEDDDQTGHREKTEYAAAVSLD